MCCPRDSEEKADPQIQLLYNEMKDLNSKVTMPKTVTSHEGGGKAAVNEAGEYIDSMYLAIYYSNYIY